MIDRSSPEFFERVRAHEDNMRALITEHGWALQGVFPTEQSPGENFVYTVGLTAKDLPELLIRTLPFEVSGSVLNAIATRMVAGEEFPTGADVYGLIADDYPVRFLGVQTDDLTLARSFYPFVRAVQVIWPDNEKRYPWDPEYDGPPQQTPFTKGGD